MKLIAKIISVPIGLFILFYCFIVGSILLSEGKHPLHPYLDTEFAPDYTPRKFDEIAIGMTKKEVVEWIGFPLKYTSKDIAGLEYINEFDYTNDGYFKKKPNRLMLIGDFAWYRSTVYFFEGKVSRIDKGWSYD